MPYRGLQDFLRTALYSYRIECVQLSLWMNHRKIARDADAMMSEADVIAAKVYKSLPDEHERRA